LIGRRTISLLFITTKFITEHELTFLNQKRSHHHELLLVIEKHSVDGMIFECGVAKGGSAIAMTAFKQPERCFYLFDTFQLPARRMAITMVTLKIC
jgi:hypothetical protein